MKGLGKIQHKYILHGSTKDTVDVLLTYYFKYRKYNAIPLLKNGFEDHKEQYIPMETIKRIANAFNKAKEYQKTVPPEYQVGVSWQGTLDDKVYPITEALRENHLNELQELFAHQQRKIYGQAGGGGS